MAEQIIDFDKATKDWDGAREHLHSLESIIRGIAGYVESACSEGSELACDIDLICKAAQREVVLSDRHLDEIENFLRACRDRIASETPVRVD